MKMGVLIGVLTALFLEVLLRAETMFNIVESPFLFKISLLGHYHDRMFRSVKAAPIVTGSMM